LRFHPVAVHPDLRKIKIAKPMAYNPQNDPVRERIRIKSVLETVIHDRYLTWFMKVIPSSPCRIR
jgi:hypothetical protein